MPTDADASPARPQLNIATIGHHGHGKTTLTAAITRVAARHADAASARALAVTDLARGSIPRGPEDTITIQFAHARYATAYRRYGHVDVPGRRDLLKNVAVGTAALDAVVLVVSATDAARAQTREHAIVARAAGAERVVVFVNKCDQVADTAWLDEVEREVREILVESGFAGDEVPFVRGSARRAYDGDAAWQDGVQTLLTILDTEIPAPLRTESGVAVLAIDSVCRVVPRVVVTARALRGVVAAGDQLELTGLAIAPRAVQIKALELFHTVATAGRAGDLVGLELAPARATDAALTRRTLRRGQVLAPTGTIVPAARFACELALLRAGEGGRRTPIVSGHRGQFYLCTADVTGTIQLGRGGTGTALHPGERAAAVVSLDRPTYLQAGMRFSLRDGSDGFQRTRSEPVTWGGTAGRGVVTEVLA